MSSTTGDIEAELGQQSHVTNPIFIDAFSNEIINLVMSQSFTQM